MVVAIALAMEEPDDLKEAKHPYEPSAVAAKLASSIVALRQVGIRAAGDLCCSMGLALALLRSFTISYLVVYVFIEE